MAAFLLMASIFHLKSSFWVETNGWKQHMWECWNIPGFQSTFTDSIRDGNDPSWDTDGNFKEWKNSVGVSYLQAREGCVLGVVAAFHQNEPVLALKVRVAAHSPPPTPQPPLVQRFVHRCGVGADQGGQDGIPAALVEGTGDVFAVVCISRWV